MPIFIEDLQRTLEQVQVEYAEARYHSRVRNEVAVGNGEVEEIRSNRIEGVGLRVLVDGAWGFSSTSSTSIREVVEALMAAVAMARVSSTGKESRVQRLADAKMAKGFFKPSVDGPLDDYSIEEKVALAVETERDVRHHFAEVKAAFCSYRELIDRKLIVNTDGAAAEIFDSKPEFRVTAVASGNGGVVDSTEAICVTGGWRDLLRKKRPEDMSRRAAETAKRLLYAKHPRGERATVILDPGMVGLISHEAVGHTVEADFVLSGSIVKGKVGEKVASEKITLVDSGRSEIVEGAAGITLVDDEGVPAGRAVVIEKGVLKTYLHNRETAAEFEAEPTGNARAFTYSDEPIIRMRNTYIEPGDYTLEEMVKEVKHGYLLKGPRGGQADANGEFMFGAQEAYLIEDGEVKDLLRGVTVSGRAFEVLQTADALSCDFSYEIGAGYCGKWQPAKVDGGGPHLRCKALVGGVR